MDFTVNTGKVFTYNYEMPAATATVVGFFKDEVLLGVRSVKSSAYPGFMSLPGGFLDVGKENVFQCAVREFKEEVNLDIHKDRLNLFHVSSEPDTDPRAHVVNSCFYVELTWEEYNSAFAGDDLDSIKFVNLKEALNTDLAFNHLDLLKRAIAYRNKWY